MTLVVMCIVFKLNTSAQFGSIESIEYDAVNERFLVSNGNNVQIADSDGNATGPIAMETLLDNLELHPVLIMEWR